MSNWVLLPRGFLPAQPMWPRELLPDTGSQHTYRKLYSGSVNSNRTEISCNGLFCILSKSEWKLLVCMFVLQVTTAYSKLTLLLPLTTPQVTSALWATTVPWAALCTSPAPWATTWMWQDRMSLRTVRTVQVVCTVQEVGWNFQPGTVAPDTTALRVKIQPLPQHTSRSYLIHLGSFIFDYYLSICIIRLIRFATI